MESLGGRVTVGDVSSRAGLTLGETERTLNALAADSEGTLQVGCKQASMREAYILAGCRFSAQLHCSPTSTLLITAHGTVQMVCQIHNRSGATDWSGSCGGECIRDATGIAGMCRSQRPAMSCMCCLRTSRPSYGGAHGCCAWSPLSRAPRTLQSIS